MRIAVKIFFFILVVCGTIFYNSNYFVETIILPKKYCFVLVVLFWFTLMMYYNIKKRNVVKLDQITCVIYAFIIYLIFRCVFSKEIDAFQIAYLWAILLLFFIIRTDEDLKGELFELIIVSFCFFQSLYGLILGNFTPPLYGSFDNPAGLAVSLVVGLPFCFKSLLSSNKYIRGYAIMTLISICLALVMSLSRAGIIAAILALLIWFRYEFKIKIDKRFFWIISVLLFIGIFFVKSNSTKGRILIWNISVNMLDNNLLFGHGYDSYIAKYMTYQADYFDQHKDSNFRMLADNVNHPFNEFLLLSIEYGLFGLFLLLLIIIPLFKKASFNSAYSQSLVMIVVLSCVSYPLRYPFLVFMLIYCVAELLKRESDKIIFISNYKRSACLFVFCNLIAMLVMISLDIKFETAWKKLIVKSKHCESELLDAGYKSLYNESNINPYFLYNYGAMLRKIGYLKESVEVLKKCEERLSDYDVQLLMAHNYFDLKEYNLAENKYIHASNMCPNRFIPLYQLVLIYEETTENDKSLELAKKIVSKEVKVPSSTISQIKARMRMKLKKVNDNKR